jgi:hypothetical protein
MPLYRPSRRSTTLLPTLLAWGGATIAGAEEFGEPKIEAPSVEFDLHDGALLAPKGFVARLGERVVMGDALRYDREHDDFYATGRVVYVMPGVRLHAERLGMHPRAESGDAWKVTAYIENAGKSMRLTADIAHFDKLNVILEGIHADGGHGGVLSVTAASAHVYLREQPAEDKQGFRREVAGVALTSATTRFLGVPVLWLPYAYRDFIYDYPWTRYVGGTSLRLGTYGRGEVASDLPSLAGWTPRIEARGDLYSRTGPGYGSEETWRSPQFGAGLFEWFDTPREVVMGGSDDRTPMETRSSHVLDAEQKLHDGFDGFGAGALYARWLTVPGADPPGLGSSPAGIPPDERYRSDYLRDDLDNRPLARRGLTGAWTLPYGSLVLDTERRDQIDLQTTDRLFGAEAILPQAQLFGQVHLSGDVWFEDLAREFANTAALRTRYTGGLNYLDWFGPWGLDAGAGMQGLRYDQGRIAGYQFDQPQDRWLPVGSAGIRLRIVGNFDDGVVNTITPRIGFEALGTGIGDRLPYYGFGDNRDILLENKRYLLTGIDTTVTKGPAPLFVGTFLATWGLREQDKDYLDLNNDPQVASNRLVSVVGHVQGTPSPTIILAGDVNFDAQSHTWVQLDAVASWVADRALVWRYTGALIPADLYHGNIWQQTPGCTVIANRYRYDVDLTFEPGSGRALAGISVEASRRMVDGLLTVFFEQVRNPDGGIYDQRVGIGFSTTFSAQPATTPVNPTHSTGVGFH